MASLRTKFMLIVAIALLGCCFAASAGDVAYDPLSKGTAHPSTSTADVAALDSANNATNEIDCARDGKLRTTLTLTAWLSSASATSKVVVVRYDRDLNGVVKNPSTTSYTFSADATDTWGGLYRSDAWAIDTAGYRYAKVFIRTISSGSVKVDWSAH